MKNLSGQEMPNPKVIIGKSEKEIEWKEKEGDYQAHEEVDGISFDGHRVLWGFSYEPHTYLKESELSGEEYRKGGWIKYFRNKVQVYEEFCREAQFAIPKLQVTLWKLQEIDWDSLKEGRKLYWKDTPAKIKYMILEQGCMIIEPDGVERFPDSIWAEEDWQKLEDPTSVKIEVIDPQIWWWRK